MAGKTISSLNVQLGGDVGRFVKSMRDAQESLVTFRGQCMSAAATVAKFTGIGAGIGAVVGAFGGLRDAVQLSAELEQTSVAFETLLGSASDAKRMMQQLTDFAASTPFEFPELATAAKSLVAFGISADQVQPALKSIGDISAGVGAPIGDIAELFGKARVQGTLYAEDINQLVGRGIPVIQEFAAQLGVSEGEVKKLASEGKIGFGNLERAFITLTAQGGKFGGMMDKQSRTLAGQWSTLKDTVSMTTAGIATELMDAFDVKGTLGKLSADVGSYAKSTLDAIKGTRAWIAENREAIKSAAAWASGLVTIVYVLPRVVAGVRAVGLAAKALATSEMAATAFTRSVWFLQDALAACRSKALALAAAHKALSFAIKGAGVAALVAFAAVTVRAIATGEKWSESCYRQLQAVGAYSDGVYKLADDAESFGKARLQLFDAQESVKSAKTIGEQVEAQKALVRVMSDRVEAARKLQADAVANGADSGFTFSNIAKMQEELDAAQRIATQLQQVKEFGKAGVQAQAARQEAADNAAAVEKTIEALEDQAYTYRLTSDEIEIYRLHQQRATAAQMEHAIALQRVNAENARAKGVEEAIAAMQEEAEAARYSAKDLAVYKLARDGATVAQILAARVAQQSLAAVEQRASINEVIGGLREQARTLGMTAAQLDAYRLAKLGATAADIAQANAINASMDAARRQQELADEAKSVIERVRTPLEKYKTTVAKLGDMLHAKLLNQQQYNAALREAQDELSATKKKQDELRESLVALTAGSAAAQLAAYKATLSVAVDAVSGDAAAGMPSPSPSVAPLPASVTRDAREKAKNDAVLAKLLASVVKSGQTLTSIDRGVKAIPQLAPAAL